jgi:hypothetical protein
MKSSHTYKKKKKKKKKEREKKRKKPTHTHTHTNKYSTPMNFIPTDTYSIWEANSTHQISM